MDMNRRQICGGGKGVLPIYLHKFPQQYIYITKCGTLNTMFDNRDCHNILVCRGTALLCRT